MDKKLIPNSTQIPNILMDFVMPRISEGETRILLYICRRTYGFHKERDRISLSQFIDGIKSKDEEILDYGCGLSRPSVVEALKNLIGANLVKVIKTGKGNYYEINLDFTDFDEVVKKVNQLRKLTKSSKESKPKQVSLLNPQKKGNKEKQSYLAKQGFAGLNEIIELFKNVNPSYEILFRNKTQRQALTRLVEKWGEEKVRGMISWLPRINNEKYQTTITTPIQLEYKLADLIYYIKNNKESKNKIVKI